MSCGVVGTVPPPVLWRPTHSEFARASTQSHKETVGGYFISRAAAPKSFHDSRLLSHYEQFRFRSMAVRRSDCPCEACIFSSS